MLPTSSLFSYDAVWSDSLRLIKKFSIDLLQAEQQTNRSIDDLSKMVHDFYKTMHDRLVNKGTPSDQLEGMIDNIERILNEHIYQRISTRIINDDEEHNMATQKRIRSLNWITTEHLDIDIDFQHPFVHDLLDQAICQMIAMNSRTSSLDKLDCIVQCSKTIFELLNNQDGHDTVPASADQFLPVLVFVVIQANPPMLPADLKFLTKFSNPSRLMSGETGYYFTNLCCALEFIEKASGASLNISDEDFQRYCNGEVVPNSVRSQAFTTYLCDGLRIMRSNVAAVKKLNLQRETRMQNIDNLMEEIEVHLEANRAKLREMQKFAKTLRLKLKPTAPDDQNDFKLLPAYIRQVIENGEKC